MNRTTPPTPVSTASQHRRPTAVHLGLAVGVPVLMLVVAYIPLLVVRSDLPDRIASHFDLSGTPDGSMSVATFVLVMSLMVAAGAALCIGTAVRAHSQGGSPSVGGFVGGFVGGLGAGLLTSTAIAQRDLDDWRNADGVGWTLLLAVATALLLGVVAAALAARLPVSDDLVGSGVAVPVMDLADGEEAVWFSTVRSVPMSMVGATGLVVGVVLLIAASVTAGAIVMFAGLLVMALASVSVRVDRNGLHVRYGHLPVPTTRIAVGRIEAASVIDVRPSEWGGWGYRGSLKLMRRAAVVHRAGPGIRVDLVDGKVFVVTVDHPENGVALLNVQVERMRASQER